MLKLKLQYFGHLMRRVDSLEKTLMLGGIGGRHSSILAWRIAWTEESGGLPSMGSHRVGHDIVTKQKAESRQTLVLGVDAQEFPGGLLRLDPTFAYAKPPSS